MFSRPNTQINDDDGPFGGSVSKAGEFEESMLRQVRS